MSEEKNNQTAKKQSEIRKNIFCSFGYDLSYFFHSYGMTDSQTNRRIEKFPTLHHSYI